MIGVLMRHANDECNRLAVYALSIRSTDKLLELGFGPGHGISLMAAQARQGHVYGIDLSEVMIEQASARNRRAIISGRVSLEHGSFEALPFADGSMEGVLAVNVAYFWTRAELIVSEVRRVLRRGGKLALYVTDRSTMQHWAFASQETHRHWDAAGLSTMLCTGGFPAISTTIEKVRLRSGVEGLLAVAEAL